MPGLRGFDRNIRSFQIADFTHHDDIRVLAQELLERRRKGQAGTVIDVDLIDARQLNFSRIFRR